jgi:hypothetical protein
MPISYRERWIAAVVMEMKTFDLSIMALAIEEKVFCGIFGLDLHQNASFSFFSPLIHNAPKCAKGDIDFWNTLLFCAGKTM